MTEAPFQQKLKTVEIAGTKWHVVHVATVDADGKRGHYFFVRNEFEHAGGNGEFKGSSYTCAGDAFHALALAQRVANGAVQAEMDRASAARMRAERRTEAPPVSADGPLAGLPPLPELEALYDVDWEERRPDSFVAWGLDADRAGRVCLGGVADAKESRTVGTFWRGWVDNGHHPIVIDRADPLLDVAKRRVLLTYRVMTA